MDTNFATYEILYGTTQGGPYTEVWDANDAANIAFRHVTTTKISPLDAGKIYYFKLYAKDDYGNTSTINEVQESTGQPTQSLIQVQVFQDENENAVWDRSESARKLQGVYLYQDDGDNIFSSAKDTKVSTQYTNRFGNVLFRNLNAGKYFVQTIVQSKERVTTGNEITSVQLSTQTQRNIYVGIASSQEVQRLIVSSDKQEVSPDEEATITVELYGKDGQRIQDQKVVALQVKNGTAKEETIQTQNGRASTTVSPTSTARITVTASHANLAASIDIDVIEKQEDRAAIGKNQQGKSGEQENNKDAQNPTGRSWGKTIQTTATVATGILAVLAAIGALSALPLTQLPIALMNLIYNALSLFGLKKPGKSWGVVYDSITKEPISLAVVRLHEESGKVAQTSITDKDGRFRFLLKQGVYTLSVSRADYRFPSQIIQAGADGKYSNIYRGKVIEVKDEEKQPVSVNIPLDSLLVAKPPTFTWVKNMIYRAIDILQRLNLPLMLVGLTGSIIIAILEPNTLAFVFIGIYCVLLALKFFIIGSYKKPWGTTFNIATDHPLPGSIVEIYDSKTTTKKGTVITDKLGRFHFLPDTGSYFLRTIRSGFTIGTPKRTSRYRKIYEPNEVIEINEKKTTVIQKNIPLKQNEDEVIVETMPKPNEMTIEYKEEASHREERPTPETNTRPRPNSYE